MFSTRNLKISWIHRGQQFRIKEHLDEPYKAMSRKRDTVMLRDLVLKCMTNHFDFQVSCMYEHFNQHNKSRFDILEYLVYATKRG
jgi:hypothetical protein